MTKKLRKREIKASRVYEYALFQNATYFKALQDSGTFNAKHC